MPKKMNIDTHSIYQYFKNQKFYYQFLKKEKSKKFIPMPPPNITGKLHMGHSLFLTIQDSLNRFYKNKGYDSIWIPGLDHAGLATHIKIEDYAKENNISYKKASTELPIKNKRKIIEQIKNIGAYPNWEYLTYTLDYNDLIYNILSLMKKENRIKEKDGNLYLNISDLAKELLRDIDSFNIIPSHEKKNLIPFLNNIEEWNITRQIPWGTDLSILNSKDRLDTWFNSSLWPIATLLKNNLEDYYPAELIETGSDILFFWCARMLMMGNYLYKNQEKLGLKIKSKYPFKTIYLHGIIRDKHNRKFSKSLGNGIDPNDMIKKYGADATRLFLITRSSAGEDFKFNENDIIIYKKFINKIYQSARFFSIYAEKANLSKIKIRKINNSEITNIQIEYDQLMSNYKFLEASRFIHSKFKTYFCDQWIEENKKEIQSLDKETLSEGILNLIQMLSMIEPFCPYLSSYIYNHFIE